MVDVRRARARWVPLACALLASACGGGGGGSGDGGTGGGGGNPPPSVSMREQPLVLSNANAADAATFAMGYGEAGLIFAQLAHEWTTAFSSGTGTSVDLTCDGGGTLNLRLVDRDGNQRASVGDQIRVSLNNCYLRSFDDALDGTATIELQATTTAGVQEAGTLSFGTRLALPGSPELLFDGALRWEFGSDRLGSTLRVLSAAVPLGIQASSNGVSLREIITALDARKDVRKDEARTSVRLALRIASDLLGGSMQVATAVPLGSWFDTVPDAGQLTASGASGAGVNIAAMGGATLQVSLGTFSTTLDPREDLTGYLWWGAGVTPPGPGNRGYAAQITAPALAVLTRPAAELRQAPAALSWQLSRPFAPVTAPLTANLVAASAGSGYAWGASSYPAEVRIDGALLTVTPSGPLEPGVHYNLQFSNTALAGPSNSQLLPPQFSATVPDTLRASAKATASGVLLGSSSTLSLDASASTSANGPITSTSWRQVSGPALTVINGNTATPTVAVAPQTSTSGTAVLELELRNSAGESDRDRVEVSVLSADTTFRLFRYQSPIEAKPTFVVAVGTDGGYASVQNFGSTTMDIFSGSTRLLISKFGNWAAGQSGSFVADDGLALAFTAQGGRADCPTWRSGSYVVSDYATDGASTITRLALDLTLDCGGPAPLRMSVRVGSVQPLP